jgi:DNA-binding SARP family transcriptional activator/pimeloyl-ACP methyl ester carboxylesterase/plasmid stabilization system protein ParE
VQFHLLGPLEVTRSGRALAVGGARTRAVLAMLLLDANRVVATDRLVDELWPEHGQERGAANLQVRLSELRRALRSVGEADRLVTRPPGYMLRIATDELDVLTFEELVRAGREALSHGQAAQASQLLGRSLGLWRGAALADVGDGRFVSAERARLEEERLGALESRIEAQLACGRHEETIAELETLTGAHPLRERFWQERLLALYRCGRQADALRAYRDVRARLTEQLGIEPGPELRELHDRILRQDPELERPPTTPGGGGGLPRPETRYAQSGDVRIAYQIVGDGNRDIVFVPGAMSHLDLLWEDAETADFFRRLSAMGRLVLFDKRDTGLSDRAPADSPLEERMDDVRAVMQAAQSERAVLFGFSEGGPMSILFAATYPDRVTGLILGAATARYRPAPGYPCGEGSEAMFASLIEIAEQRWGQGASIDWFLPSRAGSDRARQLFARFERMSVTPGGFLRIVRMVRQIDVRPVLPAIHVPTLVIQRLDDRMTPPCHGRYLASQIPGARYFEQPGDHSLRFATSGDTDRLLDEIEDFLSTATTTTQPDRVLTTILSVDAPIGAESTVLAHRGRLIRAGQGDLVATFDAPGQAIRCADAIRSVSARAGQTPRAGVHTGEVELRGEQIAGPSVVIAAAITELAQPGEILVSRTVTDLVIGSGISFADRGDHALTGVPDRWPLFAVTST